MQQKYVGEQGNNIITVTYLITSDPGAVREDTMQQEQYAEDQGNKLR